MKNARNKLLILTVLTALVLTANMSFAAKEKEKGFLIRLWEKVSARWTRKKEEKKAPERKPAVRKITPEMPEKPKKPVKIKVLIPKERLIENIGKKLDEYPEIAQKVPGLSKRRSADGRTEYYYARSGGLPLKLEEYGKEELYKLLLRIDRERLRIVQEEKKKKKKEKAPVEEKKAEEEKAEEEKIEKEKVEEEKVEEVKEKKPEEKKEEKPPRREITLSKEEMIESIRKRVKVYSQIVYMIPNFSFKETPEGGKEYYYAPWGEEPRPLMELDKETLYDLFARVNNEATRLNTERLMRQIQQQQQIMRTLPRPPQQPAQPPSQPPRVYTPPQPPRQQTPPPQPPATEPHRR